jgi:transposase
LNASHASRAHNARYEIDLIQPGAGGTGLVLQQLNNHRLKAGGFA